MDEFSVGLRDYSFSCCKDLRVGASMYIRVLLQCLHTLWVNIVLDYGILLFSWRHPAGICRAAINAYSSTDFFGMDSIDDNVLAVL